jgi:hypothetical protein
MSIMRGLAASGCDFRRVRRMAFFPVFVRVLAFFAIQLPTFMHQ